jgi:hypothetical protein
MRASCAIFLLEQAAKCRRLAGNISDKKMVMRRLTLATQYEAKAEMHLEGPEPEDLTLMQSMNTFDPSKSA